MDPLSPKDKERIWEALMAIARRQGPDPDDHLSARNRLEREYQSILLTVNALLKHLTVAPEGGYKIETQGWRQRLAATLRRSIIAVLILAGIGAAALFGGRQFTATVQRNEPAVKPTEEITAENKRIIGANEILIRANETLTKELNAARDKKTMAEAFGDAVLQQGMITRITPEAVTLTIPKKQAKSAEANWEANAKLNLSAKQYEDLQQAIAALKTVSTSE